MLSLQKFPRFCPFRNICPRNRLSTGNPFAGTAADLKAYLQATSQSAHLAMSSNNTTRRDVAASIDTAVDIASNYATSVGGSPSVQPTPPGLTLVSVSHERMLCVNAIVHALVRLRLYRDQLLLSTVVRVEERHTRTHTTYIDINTQARKHTCTHM